jgi:hypothetical protein
MLVNGFEYVACDGAHANPLDSYQMYEYCITIKQPIGGRQAYYVPSSVIIKLRVENCFPKDNRAYVAYFEELLIRSWRMKD